MTKEVAVVILNWNGKNFLEQFLPSIVEHNPSFSTIYVADNASTDDSLDFLKSNYPTIKTVVLDRNYGFAGGYNKALKQINADYYVLLNSDVEVSPNWLNPMITLMELDGSIGACQPKIKDYNRKEYFEYAGAAGGYLDKYGYPFCQGRIFDTLEQDRGQYDRSKEIFWASGACMCVKADLYHQLDGLDDYFFAHMEEIDLCWRMKNKGYKVMYCAEAEVFHVGGGTLNKINPRKTFLNYRNSLLMLHKNLPKNGRYCMIFKRLTLDGVSAIKLILEGKFEHCFAIFKAHLSFYGSLSQNKKKRTPENNPNLVGRKPYSIIRQYFLKNVKTYAELPK